MKKYSVSYSETSNAVTTEQIWKMWTDINNWPSWDKGLEFCAIPQNFCFAIGQSFKLRPIGVPVDFFTTIVDLKEKTFFKDKTETPFGTVEVLHSVHETADGVCLTHHIEAVIYEHLVENFEKSHLTKWKIELPQSVKNLITKASVF